MSLNSIPTTGLDPSLSWPVCSPGVSEHICSLHNACFSFSFSLSHVCFFLLSYTGASSSAHPLNRSCSQLFVGSLSLLTSHAFSEQSYPIDSSSMASMTIQMLVIPQCLLLRQRGFRRGSLCTECPSVLEACDLFTPFRAFLCLFPNEWWKPVFPQEIWWSCMKVTILVIC